MKIKKILNKINEANKLLSLIIINIIFWIMWNYFYNFYIFISKTFINDISKTIINDIPKIIENDWICNIIISNLWIFIIIAYFIISFIVIFFYNKKNNLCYNPDLSPLTIQLIIVFISWIFSNLIFNMNDTKISSEWIMNLIIIYSSFMLFILYLVNVTEYTKNFFKDNNKD